MGPIRVASILLLSTLGLACAGDKQRPVTRSPSHDYRDDAPRAASDGRVIGAGELSPADRIQGSATVGPGGGLAPGWYVEDGQLKYDPERQADPMATPHDHDEPPSKGAARPPAQPKTKGPTPPAGGQSTP